MAPFLMTRLKLLLILLVVFLVGAGVALALSLPFTLPRAASSSGVARTVYVQAETVTWNYTPQVFCALTFHHVRLFPDFWGVDRIIVHQSHSLG